MKILITGGSGFIGKNLVEYLSSKHDVAAPSHKELEFLNEAAVERYLKLRKFDIIIHTAGIPCNRKIKNPKDVAIGNLRMFFNIVRNSDTFSKMIFLGSGSEYDMRYGISGVAEKDFDKRVPADELGFSKYISSKYIENSEKIVNLRIFGVFGKYEDYQIRFISNAICKSIYGLPITIKQNRLFSYLYIDDLCPIVEFYINNNNAHKIYNVVPRESFELAHIAKRVNEISGKDLEIIISAQGMGKEYTADNSLLMKEIGDFKFTALEEAIRRLYEWYEGNKNTIDRELLLYDP